MKPIDPFAMAALAKAYKARCERYGWTRPELLVLLPNDLPLCPDCGCCNMRRVACEDCDGKGLWFEVDDVEDWAILPHTCSTCDGERGWWICMGPCPHAAVATA